MQGGFLASGCPTIPIQLFGHDLDAIIDTGFEGGLHLPGPLLIKLGPSPVSIGRWQMKSPLGHSLEREVYEVDILIDGLIITVDAIFGETEEALLGTRFLKDYRLTVDYPAGTVEMVRGTP